MIQEDFLQVINKYQYILKKYCIIYGSGIMTSEDLYQEVLYNLCDDSAVSVPRVAV